VPPLRRDDVTREDRPDRGGRPHRWRPIGFRRRCPHAEARRACSVTPSAYAGRPRMRSSGAGSTRSSAGASPTAGCSIACGFRPDTRCATSSRSRTALGCAVDPAPVAARLAARRAARHNAARDRTDIQIFESGTVYRAAAAGPRADEHHALGALMTAGSRPPPGAGTRARADFLAAKALARRAAHKLGVSWSVEPATWPFLHPGRSARVLAGAERVGFIGEVHPLVAEAWDLGAHGRLCRRRRKAVLRGANPWRLPGLPGGSLAAARPCGGCCPRRSPPLRHSSACAPRGGDARRMWTCFRMSTRVSRSARECARWRCQLVISLGRAHADR